MAFKSHLHIVGILKNGSSQDFLHFFGESRPKSRSAKKVFKTGVFLLISDNFLKFLQKNAKKCKFLLIFTPNFTPKTNKSYKITLFTITSHPIFQNFPQKPIISLYFLTFFIFFCSLFPFGFRISCFGF